MFSVSAFNTKRQMSLRQGTEQVCLSHFQVRFFSRFGFCGAAVRADANSHSPQWVPRSFWHPGVTFPVFSAVLFPLQVHSLPFLTLLCPPAHGDRLPDSLLILKHSSFPVKEPPLSGGCLFLCHFSSWSKPQTNYTLSNQDSCTKARRLGILLKLHHST